VSGIWLPAAWKWVRMGMQVLQFWSDAHRATSVGIFVT